MESQKTFAIGPKSAFMARMNAEELNVEEYRGNWSVSGHGACIAYWKRNYEGTAVFFGSVSMSSIYDDGCVCDIAVDIGGCGNGTPEQVEFLYQEFLKIAGGANGRGD